MAHSPVHLRVLIVRAVVGRNVAQLRAADIGAHRIDERVPAVARRKPVGCIGVLWKSGCRLQSILERVERGVKGMLFRGGEIDVEALLAPMRLFIGRVEAPSASTPLPVSVGQRLRYSALIYGEIKNRKRRSEFDACSPKFSLPVAGTAQVSGCWSHRVAWLQALQATKLLGRAYYEGLGQCHTASSKVLNNAASDWC